MSNVHKRATTDVNSQMYVCKSNRSTKAIYNCSNLCCMSIHALDSTDHTGRTTLQTTQVMRIYCKLHSNHSNHYNTIETHHTIQCCKEMFTHGPEQYRVQTPASPFTTVSSPSEAVSYLLAWLLPRCWRQTVAQPIRTSHLQTILLLLATPHLQCGNASALNK